MVFALVQQTSSSLSAARRRALSQGLKVKSGASSSSSVRSSRRGAARVFRAEASPIGEDEHAAPAEVHTRVALSPLAVNLDISPPVLPSSSASKAAAAHQQHKALKGNLAPKNPPPGTVPPPPTTPPPRHLKKTTPAAPPPKRGKEEEGKSKAAAAAAAAAAVMETAESFKAPTTFFSHQSYYVEPKRTDVTKLREDAESTYGRRGHMGVTMSRARDVAIAGSALRTRRRSPSPSSASSGRSIRGNSRAEARAKKAAKAAAALEAKKKKILARNGGNGNGGDMYTHKRRVMRALDVEREELPDGCIMFRFSEKPLTAKEQRALISEEEAEAAEVELLHNHADEYQPHISVATGNVVSRWMMTVQFLASTLSLESAAFYVLTTPFRTGFWTMAYTLRLVWWLCSGRMLPGRAAKRAKALRGPAGGDGGAFAAIDEQSIKLETKQTRAEKMSGGTVVNGRDMRNVLL